MRISLSLSSRDTDNVKVLNAKLLNGKVLNVKVLNGKVRQKGNSHPSCENTQAESWTWAVLTLNSPRISIGRLLVWWSAMDETGKVGEWSLLSI